MSTKLPVHKIAITKEPIRLGQFLKLADHVQDGIEAKFLILNEEVWVNNQIETRRGRKLFHNDTVETRKKVYQVEYAPGKTENKL